jgi:hypothetical protein
MTGSTDISKQASGATAPAGQAEMLGIPQLIDLIQKREFELPNVQRGFIWKPHQIENLWDSLLRRFPTGSIIINKMQDGKYQLLDGQQRTTSIALGFADLGGEKKNCGILNSSAADIRIFIDTRKPERDKEGRCFAFRVITRSHPWGYQHLDNSKPLTANNKTKAREDLWKIKDPFEDGIMDRAYPYDACAPLPLNIFTNALMNKDKTLGEIEKELTEWIKKIAPPDKVFSNITTWLFEVKHPDQTPPQTYSIKEIYDKIEDMWNQYQIPMLPLPQDFFQDTADVQETAQTNLPVDEESGYGSGDNGDDDEIGNNDKPEESDYNSDDDGDDDEIDSNNDKPEESDYDSDDDDDGEIGNNNDKPEETDENDDVEEVFIRLNSAGTPLSGEELNYSIIKAKIGWKRELQRNIENACKGIMKPARFITIAYRLYQHSKDEDSSVKVNLRIKPKQFQREMTKEYTSFLDFIQKEILDKNLLGKVRQTLKMNEIMTGNSAGEADDDYRLPYPLFIKIAAAGQGEIMFILMYRLLYRGDVFQYDCPLHRQMIGIILMFMWHGKDARSRYDKLLNSVWPEVKDWSFANMWSKEIIKKATREKTLKRIPKNKDFFNTIEAPRIDASVPKKCKESGYSDFFTNVMCQRELLLWIQRRLLSNKEYFKEELFRLDDTDVPFDWDHISPNKYVTKKKYIPGPLKYMYQQPANLRAWPYQLNRSDSDKSPAEKLVKGPDGEVFRKYSFCRRDWLAFDNTWQDQIKENWKWKEIYALMLNRWKDMYNELRRELLKNLANG